MTPVTQVSPIEAEIELIDPTKRESAALTLGASAVSEPAGTSIWQVIFIT
jgi:hypothetical protein